ncbi:FadR family transcriptional regulator [Amycolatopsis rubida]|uniref:FadR family transcriptional regulator n=1 Tax=Amycolatopsis rubida TaxID=112413 RepID=A0ABX0BV09_9PSEU|nr:MULTISPECIES: FCD domain-containing protein [Amycolatopsis]MYW91697.1 FCD domain-containing protein [Amycolatopsis rubida]NEC56681.1 FadR family transcriptional regulator [Amycolatopsis rubida]OAP20428.1 HTH-type transcriptional regulator LutR [Amycolatopsis sp. M39]
MADAGRITTRPTAAETMVSHIRDQILSGELKPGSRLPPETELSSHYNVGRNAAREALRALAAQGLLEIRRGVTGGVFVTIPSPEHAAETLWANLAMLTDGAHLSFPQLVEVRELLEVPAAEMAAARRTEEQVSALRRTLFDPASVDPIGVFVTNRDFHFAVLDAAHNPLLKLVAEPIFRTIEERFLRERAPRRFWYNVDRQHREVLECIERGDRAGAREAAREHVRFLSGVYEKLDRDLVDPA